MLPKKTERLAPPLMYAFRAAHEKRDANQPLDLRDKRGERVIATRRAPSRALISEPALRREVSAELADLFNTINLGSAVDLEDAPEVARSVLNFGFPDLAQMTIDERRLFDLPRDIELALKTFEPRLDPKSLTVGQSPLVDTEGLTIKFHVKADLRAEPVDVAVEFVAEVELDTAKIKIERL